eukprot:4360831-Amphidinium_carterae.1
MKELEAEEAKLNAQREELEGEKQVVFEDTRHQLAAVSQLRVSMWGRTGVHGGLLHANDAVYAFNFVKRSFFRWVVKNVLAELIVTNSALKSTGMSRGDVLMDCRMSHTKPNNVMLDTPIGRLPPSKCVCRHGSHEAVANEAKAAGLKLMKAVKATSSRHPTSGFASVRGAASCTLLELQKTIYLPANSAQKCQRITS